MTPREKVERELERYEHLLLRFGVRETGAGLELTIALKSEVPGAHEYFAPLHPRDLDHPQFAWSFQRYLYDCLHDYLCELFTRNPQMKEDAP